MTDHTAEHLAHAIKDLAAAVRQASSQTGTTSILQRLDTMENKIISAISEFAAKQKAFNDQQSASIDSISTSVTGIQGDINSLNQKITDLQNSPGTITPEDQALLDDLQMQGAAISSRLQVVAGALGALDALTPPAPPTV